MRSESTVHPHYRARDIELIHHNLPVLIHLAQGPNGIHAIDHSFEGETVLCSETDGDIIEFHLSFPVVVHHDTVANEQNESDQEHYPAHNTHEHNGPEVENKVSKNTLYQIIEFEYVLVILGEDIGISHLIDLAQSFVVAIGYCLGHLVQERLSVVG